jgi:excisionase family DNA binding protein
MSDCSDLPEENRRGDKHYTIKELAAEWGRNHKTIRKLVNSGKLEGFKCGSIILISETAIKRYKDEFSINKPLPVKPVAVKKPSTWSGGYVFFPPKSTN